MSTEGSGRNGITNIESNIKSNLISNGGDQRMDAYQIANQSTQYLEGNIIADDIGSKPFRASAVASQAIMNQTIKQNYYH